MSVLSNAALESYYRAEVEMRREVTKAAVEHVIPIVTRIMDYINKKDPRFDKNLYCVGSQYQGLKVKRADEFDFSVPVLGLPKLQSSASTPRYYNFNRPFEQDLDTLPDDLKIVKTTAPLPPPPTGYHTIHVEQSYKDLAYDGDVIPFLVKQAFKKLLQEAIRSLYQGDQKDKPRLARKANGPALMLRIPFSHGSDPDMEEISVDLSPCLPTQLEFTAYIGWPRRTQWPDSEKVASIQRVGINCKAKKAFYWMRCYANCEKELLLDIDKDGGCRKKCHRIMKRVREHFWCTSNKPGVSSYIVKNILLWECEAYPNTSDWAQDKLAERFMSMVQRLLRCLAEKRVPRYFEPAFNLLAFDNPTRKENLKLETQKIQAFHANPMLYLSKINVKGA